MRPLKFDASQFPLIRVHVTAEYSGEDVHEWVNELEEYIQDHKGYFVMVYETGGHLISADTRVVLGDRLQYLLQRYPERFLGISVVIKSIISRMMAKGALMLVRTQHKIKLVESPEAAVRQAESWLNDVGLSIPNT